MNVEINISPEDIDAIMASQLWTDYRNQFAYITEILTTANDVLSVDANQPQDWFVELSEEIISITIMLHNLEGVYKIYDETNIPLLSMEEVENTVKLSAIIAKYMNNHLQNKS